jgi:N-methylhydantoinase B
LGFVRDYRILTDEVRFSMRTDKHAIEPFGSDDGLAGGKGACVVNPGGDKEKRLPSRFGDQRLSKGDLLRIERPGGGGLGNPLSRAAEQVLEDVRQGYVSVERARSEYNVAISYSDTEPCLDLPETQVLRGRS